MSLFPDSPKEVIPPYEQIYLLNRRLICNAAHLENAVITVGGQAVQYWVSFYHQRYIKLPDERLVTSVDCDYSAKRSDLSAISNILNIKDFNINRGNPPSIAKVMLIDRETFDIQVDGGRLFAVPNEPELANVIDVIDHPSGFTYKDFTGENLYLHTSPFYIDSDSPDVPVMDEKIRVLTPIACIRSRFSNLTKLKRNPEIECARINALKVPCYYFLLEMFDTEEFRVARKYFMQLYDIAMNNEYVTYQAFFENLHGPLQVDQQSNNINIFEILNAVYLYLKDNEEDFSLPDNVISHDLVRKVDAAKEKLEKYKKLCKEKSRRSPRKGFEINSR